MTGPASGSPGDPVLRGFGTPTVDGVQAPGEWDAAGHIEFSVSRSATEGGGFVPATLYVMNDASNLYLALKVMDASVGASLLSVSFDANHDGNYSQEGEDSLRVDEVGNFYDQFTHWNGTGWRGVEDVAFGGTSDGDEVDDDNPGFAFFEFVHPLNDADNAHDLNLSLANQIGVRLYFQHCVGNCGILTDSPPADIVVVSGSHVAPDTQITKGPTEGTLTAETILDTEFTGTDDAIPPSALTFECKIDSADWRSCVSPHEEAVDDSRHVFSVRAIDEMLNVDATPAQRSWTVDTTGPSKPVVRGPRVTRKRVAVLRFSARDEFTPASRIRFRCAVDSTRLRRCPAVYRVRLRRGRHLVRVRALDSLGNQSDISKFGIRVKRNPR